ncbi:MAG TPA: TolC family protein [Bryobacteraceae bacterium]|nr:TolC family protein [Bryobacteraceae bacterium]
MKRLFIGGLSAALFVPMAFAQTALTWEQVKAKFKASNPTVRAAQLTIDESRAEEITAYLRPNPSIGTGLDQIVPFSTQPSPVSGLPVYRPLTNNFPSLSISYLHERDHKRELRLEAARKSTDIASSTYDDQERNLLFNLRNAFVQVLQAKAVAQNARKNLSYWDRELDVNRKRLAAGDLAQVDMDRLELQRVQFESDLATAIVNLRTSKIQILMLLDDRTAIERFDIAGTYDFSDRLDPIAEFRSVALASRPDLKAAVQNVELARANHQLAIANGSTDPTFSVDFARNPPIPFYFGLSVSIPLRIFDRNQGEKARTAIDVRHSERVEDAAKAQVYSDVDSAYYTVVSTLDLLKPYRDRYLRLAEETRNKVAFSYQNGGASLLDYLDAEKSYRDTRLAYLNLVGSYLTAAAQMNMAVGREVIL